MPTDLDAALFDAGRADPTDRELVARLLAAGADPNASGWSGNVLFPDIVSALTAHLPRRNPDPEVVRSLLARGADPNARSPDRGYGPLFVAASYNHTEIVRVLLEHGAKPDATTTAHWEAATPLAACASARIDASLHTARLLLDAGATVDLCPPRGRTALVYAIQSNNRPVVELLVDRGASLSGVDEDTGPLHHAVSSGHPELVRLLVARGADPCAPGPGGAPPIDVAVGRGDLSLVDQLLELGARIDQKDHDGATPLARYVSRPRPDAALARALLERGADPRAVDARGATLLHRAVAARSVEIVRALLERGADSGRRDAEGRTPGDRARELGLPLIEVALGAHARPPEAPTDLFVALLHAGLIFDDAWERIRLSNDLWSFVDRGGPYEFEQPWTEEEVRERVAWRLLHDPANAGPIEAFLADGLAAFGHRGFASGEAAQRLRDLEPERAARAGVDLSPEDVARMLEVHLRKGGSIFHSNKEGCESWRFDPSASPGAELVYETQGDGGSSSDACGPEAFRRRWASTYQIVRGLVRAWPDALSDARTAMTSLGHASIRSWIAAR